MTVMCECCGTGFVSICLFIHDVCLPIPGRYIASSELVPGDVYEISDPSLTQFPCDSLLLAGDCIVNESMLTGTEPIHQC